MSYQEKLSKWAEEEKSKGLVDVRFFPGINTEVSLEEAAKNVYEALTESTWKDISDIDL